MWPLLVCRMCRHSCQMNCWRWTFATAGSCRWAAWLASERAACAERWAAILMWLTIAVTRTTEMLLMPTRNNLRFSATNAQIPLFIWITSKRDLDWRRAWCPLSIRSWYWINYNSSLEGRKKTNSLLLPWMRRFTCEFNFSRISSRVFEPNAGCKYIWFVAKNASLTDPFGSIKQIGCCDIIFIIYPVVQFGE